METRQNGKVVYVCKLTNCTQNIYIFDLLKKYEYINKYSPKVHETLS